LDLAPSLDRDRPLTARDRTDPARIGEGELLAATEQHPHELHRLLAGPLELDVVPDKCG
jgi:hypothetical protein